MSNKLTALSFNPVIFLLYISFLTLQNDCFPVSSAQMSYTLSPAPSSFILNQYPCLRALREREREATSQELLVPPPNLPNHLHLHPQAVAPLLYHGERLALLKGQPFPLPLDPTL